MIESDGVYDKVAYADSDRLAKLHSNTNTQQKQSVGNA